MVVKHNATTKRGIVGLTLPSMAEGTAQGSERSRGPRAVPKARGGGVEPIITSEVKSTKYASFICTGERES
jgi:hypothetical protein